MPSYFALVDCNNFYASCERVFNPRLTGKPVVVLSNNDGCVIARSEEAKEVGIPMGTPLFKIKQLISRSGVTVFSANFTLYGDMSRRVMEVLSQHCPDVEIYSIDEAFLKISFPAKGATSMIKWAEDLCATVYTWTGIPVSIGIGTTKTLAKLANHIAKRYATTGAYVLHPQAVILREIAVGKVWGVGSRYCARLAGVGIKTVSELQEVREAWMRKEFGVVGLRLLKELRGEACQGLEPPVSARKHMMVSRSFAEDIYALDELQRRLALYATRMGEKLRAYGQAAGIVTVYLWVNTFRNRRKDGRTCFMASTSLPFATNDTNHLISWSKSIAAALYEEGTNYKKAGIMVGQLVSEGITQGHLFLPTTKLERDRDVTHAIDTINAKMGRSMVYFAACGERPSIPLRQDYRSRAFTTRWSDLLII